MVMISKTITPDPTGAYIPILGYRATVSENVVTATGVDLFTVTGKVLITMWMGEVTVALSAAVTDYKLRVKTANVDLVAVANFASAAAGFIWSMSGDPDLTILTGGATAYTPATVKTTGTNGLGNANRIVGLAGGSLILQSLRTASVATGTMVHNLWYFPLESGASVVAI